MYFAHVHDFAPDNAVLEWVAACPTDDGTWLVVQCHHAGLLCNENEEPVECEIREALQVTDDQLDPDDVTWLAQKPARLRPRLRAWAAVNTGYSDQGPGVFYANSRREAVALARDFLESRHGYGLGRVRFQNLPAILREEEITDA